MLRKTSRSWEKYRKSLACLGAGSSTGSKRPSYENIEPAVIVRGRGCRVWDADGNEYIDFRSGIGPVSLGYSNPRVNRAIKNQLKDGIVFGHPNPLEGEVAGILVRNIPCAEKVRFLKTGGEAVAACMKIARAATGRNRIVQCGYNGWLNTLSTGGFMPVGISSSQPLKGVPSQVAALHSTLPWGRAEEWEKMFAVHGSEIAAVVIASAYDEMSMGREFLPAVRDLTRKYGILMVMDEIVTGFRLAIGGAHEYFGIMPDMAVFGKGLANGMPVTVYAGRADLIDMAREIGISSTFGGETLSLAAVKATVEFYREHDVINRLWRTGKVFQDGINSLFSKHGFAAVLKGFPVCPRFIFRENGDRDEFFKNCYRRGVSFYNVPYVTYAHGRKDISETLKRVEMALRDTAGI